jgi:hypothetical protein
MFNNNKQLFCSNKLRLEIKEPYKVVFGVLFFMDQEHGP